MDSQRWNFKLTSISKMQNIAELSNKRHTYQHPLHFILAAWLGSMLSANNCVRLSPASWISWSGYRQHTRSTASMTSYQWPHVGSLSIVPRTLFWLARVNESEESVPKVVLPLFFPALTPGEEDEKVGSLWRKHSPQQWLLQVHSSRFLFHLLKASHKTM